MHLEKISTKNKILNLSKTFKNRVFGETYFGSGVVLWLYPPPPLLAQIGNKGGYNLRNLVDLRSWLKIVDEKYYFIRAKIDFQFFEN